MCPRILKFLKSSELTGPVMSNHKAFEISIMRFDYLTNDGEKSLAPFFSPMMLSITFNCVWILGFVLTVFWPLKELFNFIQGHEIPLSFLGTFVGALLIYSYVNLRCGRGEIFPKNIFSRMVREGITTFEEENDFLSYGLVQSILHTIFFILLVFPLLIFSAAISGITFQEFLKALSILFTASLLCRLFSFLIYLLFGRWSLVGLLSTRIFFIFFFFATWFLASFINPILLIYSLYKGEEIVTGSPINAFPLYMMIVTSSILLLTLANQVLVRRNMHKESLA